MILPFLPEGSYAILINYMLHPEEPARHGECHNCSWTMEVRRLPARRAPRAAWLTARHAHPNRPSCGGTSATSARCTTR